jgi:CAI-1 autoinducer synthase
MMSAVFQQEESLGKNLEKKFAAYLGFENAVLCQSGWAANVGLIQAIAEENTPVYIDFMTHMSLWEGIKSAGARPISFRHNDVLHLEKLIKQHGCGIIAVDSVYSTNGSVSPLPEIIAIGNKYGCILVIDESHSLGTHGPNGKGMVYELGLSDQVHFLTASLAKAFVNRTGLIACSKEFAGYFPYISRPAIFSSAILPVDLAALKATLKIISEADDRRKKLRQN